MADLRRNAFALGPMMGSAMEILGNLHPTAAPADPLITLYARFTEAMRRYQEAISTDEADELLGECCDAMLAAADAIVDAEPTTLEGALIKLRIVVRDLKQERTIMKGEEPCLTWHDKGTISVLADLERLVGRARA